MDHNSDDMIQVGPMQVRLGDVAAYIFFHLGESWPEQITHDLIDWDGKLFGTVETYASAQAFREWATTPEPEGSSPEALLESTEQFLRGLDALLIILVTYEDIWSRGEDNKFPNAEASKEAEDRIQFQFYEAAKATFGDEKASIRKFFRYLYLCVTQTQNGPRWGPFILMLTYEGFISTLEKRLTAYF